MTFKGSPGGPPKPSPPPVRVAPMIEPSYNMHRPCSFIMYMSWHGCSAVVCAYPIPLCHTHRTSLHITARPLVAVGPCRRCYSAIIATAPMSCARPRRAGRAGRGLLHRPPRLLWEGPTAEAPVDDEGTELPRLDRPRAQLAPGAAAAAATAVRAAPAPPRALPPERPPCSAVWRLS